MFWWALVDSPIPSPIISSSFDSQFCSSITPSLFHSCLKSYLFHKSYHRSFASSPRTAFADYCQDRFFWATRFLFSVSLFFVYVPCARLDWPYRQLLSAGKYTVSYRTVSHRIYLFFCMIYQKAAAARIHQTWHRRVPLWVLKTYLFWGQTSKVNVMSHKK